MIVIKGGEISERSGAGSFEPVLRFFVCSDIHIKGYGDLRCGRLESMMRFAHKISSGYGGPDAFLFAGDIADRGRRSQLRAFSHTAKRLAGGARILAVTANFHDNRRGCKNGNECYRSLFRTENDFHTVIHGFHFIGISTCNEPGVYYGEAQRLWLEEELRKATQDSPIRPVFVMHHEHVKNTVYGSSDFDGWGNDFFSGVFEKYPQVVHLSGHSHYPLNDPRSLWQGSFTALGTGALNYAEFTAEGKRKLHPAGFRSISQCWMIDADGEGRLLLRGFDCITETVLCEYLIEPPFSCPGRDFHSALSEFCPAPSFPRGSKASAYETEDEVVITFPAAQEILNNPCFLYRVFLFDENDNVIDSGFIINQYWRVSRNNHYTVRLKRPGCCFRAAVCAENSFGKRSDYLWV